MEKTWNKGSIIAGQPVTHSERKEIHCPYKLSDTVGNLHYASKQDIEQAIALADDSFNQWNSTPVHYRSACLDRLANLLEDNKHELVALCHKEAGKTLHDSIDEIREAVGLLSFLCSTGQRKIHCTINYARPHRRGQ